MEPGVVRQCWQEEREVLEARVAAVATLGKLAATVTAPRRSTWPLLYPESLHQDLREFIWNLRDTLDHGDVTSLGQRGVTPLGQALATPGATWADVRAAVRGWRELVDELDDKWFDLVDDAADLLDELKNRATTRATDEDTDEEINEDTDEDTDEETDETDEDTAMARDGDLMDDSAGWGTSGDNLVATAQQTPTARADDEFDWMLEEHYARMDEAKVVMKEAMVAAAQQTPTARADDEFDWMLEEHYARMDEAEEVMKVAMVAASWAETATGRDQLMSIGLLGRLVYECKKASLLTLELDDRIKSIEAALEGTEEASPDVPEALVAMVAKFEQLWEASARLTTRHLLVTLGEIDFLLLSPYSGSGGRRGPRGRAVAKRCRKAIKGIPRLLKGQ